MIAFIKDRPRLLAFGFLLTFFSSFGQTFLLSLYVPEIAASLGISEGRMGSLYAVATMGSAVVLSYVGRFIDYMDLRKYALLAVGGYVLALTGLSFANSVVFVVLCLLAVRLTGQGMMGHISITTMSRYFERTRGKAVSVATMGFPAGEAFWPVIIATVMGLMGWRATLQASGILVGVVLGGLVWWLLRGLDTSAPVKVKKGEKKVSMWSFLKMRAFWTIAPNVLLLGFVNTAVFFYQVPLGASKGWSKEWVAGSLAAFAASSALSTMLAGVLVDKWSAKKMFPWHLVPYVGGLVLLSQMSAAWVYPASLALMGIGQGVGNTVKSSLMAELFGTKVLGSVRSLFTVSMVASTAMGPLLYGLFLDVGVNFAALILGSAVLSVLILLQGFAMLRRQG